MVFSFLPKVDWNGMLLMVSGSKSMQELATKALLGSGKEIE
jgi:hypothetical protein